jgi:hypothetical protein
MPSASDVAAQERWDYEVVDLVGLKVHAAGTSRHGLAAKQVLVLPVFGRQ